MKKHLLFFMTLFWSVWSFGQNVGDSFTSDGKVYNITSTSPATVEFGGYLSFSGSTANIMSIVTYNSATYTVTRIGVDAFFLISNLTSVIIPDSVTSIGDRAFIGCTNLTSVTIGNSVTSIGQEAFSGTGLTTVTFPNSLTVIGDSAFLGADLTSVTIPNSVISIGFDAFSYNEVLTSVILGNSLTSINSWVFANCPNLTSVTIPNSVTSIGNYAFVNTGLTSLTIPNSVTSIGYSAFSNCANLNSVTVNWASPLPIDSSVFEYTPISNAILKVPAGTKALYQAASVWQNFGSIVEPATHLNFDGTDDSVSLPVNIGNTLSGGTEVTIEYWFKGTNIQSAVRIQNTSNWIVAGWNLAGNPQFLISTDGGTNGVVIANSSTIQDNTWHHVACVWKKNEIFATYLDGVLQNSRVAANVNLPIFSGNNGFLGALLGSSEFTNGNLDDVRIWNVARTAAQINGSKNCELQGNESGLLAYYKFNQGFDAADNTAINTLTDATANAYNGTLTNFAKTGTTSNFLAGSPVTTDVILPALAIVTTPVTYNQGATATALTATVGINGTSLVWYTTATGGAGAATAPTPSTATVGSTSYWVSSANANGCESERTEIVVEVAIPANHYRLSSANNGSNFVSINYDTGGLDLPNTFTTELWFNSSERVFVFTGQDSEPINNLYFFSVGLDNKLNFRISNFFDYQEIFVSNQTLSDNVWHHIALSRNSSNTYSFFIDGVLDSSFTPMITIQEFNISEISADDAAIDEYRVWNVARTEDQINVNKNCELLGTEAGLLAYYKFNQGLNAVNNTSITTVFDATANQNNAQIPNNHLLTGTTQNFLAGSPVTTGVIVPAIATVTTPVVYTQGATATALTATVGANGTSLVWYTAATSGTAITVPTPSTASIGSTSYWVSSTNANGCESERTEIVVTVNASLPATHLNFDGVNDYVQIPKTFNSDFTIEFWVKTTTTSSTGSQWYFGKSLVDNEVGGVASDFGTALVGNKLAFGIGSPDVTIFSTSDINDGNWNHIAVSWKQSSGEMKLYVNGVNESSGTGSTIQRTASNFIKLASNNYLGNYFNGDIDEVRIWNRALPIAEIQNNIGCELPSPSTQNGLLAYYQFNQGSNALNNTSITSLTDSSGNANNGTLSGFALTGATSNWLAGSSIVTGINCAVLSNSNFEMANNIKMYPNPTNNFVTVDVNNLTNAKLEVLDITGKILMNQSLNTSSNTIDVQELPSGMYLFKVYSDEGTATSKIIKN